MTITFNTVCSLLQSIENISTRQPRLPAKREKESIRQIVSNWFSNQREALDHPLTHGSAVLSALFPHRRKDRVYGLQAPSLAKKLTRLLAFNHGQRALFDGWHNGTQGDLGIYLERAMRPWDGTFGSKPVFPIERIDQLLVQLAASSRFSNRDLREQRKNDVNIDTELKSILVRLESWEAKWLVRLMLRNHCSIELDEDYVLKQFHFLLSDLLLLQDDFDVAINMLRGELSCFPAAPDSAKKMSMHIEASKRLMPVVGVKVGRPVFHKAWSFKHCFQLTSKRAWAAEVKYDGEYCEIHVDLNKAPNEIKIFSKNGKDATADRKSLHGTIRKALRIGRPDCLFKSKCIVLGEMVLYCEREKKILPFSKIRKHISRSGSFIGTMEDSLPHEWEHLMIVFFDVLAIDDERILRHCLQDRRKILRNLVSVYPGRSMRSEWSLLDFKTGDGATDLKQVFARNLASRQEGLVLKPLHAPYFPLLSDDRHQRVEYFIKLKKDYLSDMGGQRDLGDFAVIGASFDAQVAPKTDVKPLHWTHFHLGCCVNRDAVQRAGVKPKFKVVASLSLDKCIPKVDVKYLNVQGYVRQTALRKDGSTAEYDIEHSKGYDRRMTAAFKKPFVAEILGGGFEKLQNETFEMLRHPRVKKLHHDRTWEDAVTMSALEQMAEEKWDVPDADQLDGHAKDVALLVTKYAKAMRDSQETVTTIETTQETTQQTTDSVSIPSPQTPSDAVLNDSQQGSHISSSTTASLSTSTSTTHPSSPAGSTQATGTRASRSLRILVREDTSERPSPLHPTPHISPPSTSTSSSSSATTTTTTTAPPTTTKKRPLQTHPLISPPTSKRRRILSPLTAASNRSGNTHLGAFAYDSQEGVVHVYAKAGVRVSVHGGGACRGRGKGEGREARGEGREARGEGREARGEGR